MQRGGGDHSAIHSPHCSMWEAVSQSSVSYPKLYPLGEITWDTRHFVHLTIYTMCISHFGFLKF